jgi:hypothetical protein
VQDVSNPWVGLRPFELEDRELFFGRKRESQIVSNLVATLPILVVYAPSGTGKSSLINAGLAPNLSEDDHAEPLVEVDPRRDALAQVREALGGDGAAAADGDADLADVLEEHARRTESRPVVVMDQFEERLNAGTPADELFAALAKMVHAGTDAACVVLSIREDYLGGLEPLMRRVPGLLDASYRVPALSREALEAAVYGPIEAAGHGVSVQKSLVEQVLDDLEQHSNQLQEPGEQRFEPGYFQVVWATLWKAASAADDSRLTVKHYRELGGAERILKDFTSNILAALEPAQAEMFWAMARYLVLPTGAKTSLTVDDITELLQEGDYLKVGSSYRTSSWLEIGLSPDRREQLIRAVLTQLTSSRAPLFKREIRSDREEYELLHDLLGKIILDWRREFEKRRQADVASRLERLSGEAEKTARQWGITQQRARTTGQPAIKRAAAEAHDCLTRVESVHGEVAAHVAQEATDRMTVLRGVVESARSAMDWDDWWAIRGGWEHESEAFGQTLLRRAIDDPTESVRRAFQHALPLWSEVHAPVTAPLERKRGRAAAMTLLAAALAIAPAALGAVLVHAIAGGLHLHYVGLVMANVALVFTLVYTAKLNDTRDWRGDVKTALVPAATAKSQRAKRNGAPATWPLPVLYSAVGGLAGAWICDAAGWGTTAGFAMGAGYAAAAGVALAIVAFDQY